MSKVINQDQIREMYDKHSLWMSGEKGGEKACFKDAILNNICFQGTDFPYADFSNASINDCDFSEVCLDNANFEHTNMNRTNFFRASLRNTSFFEAQVYNTQFRYALFQEAQLSDAFFGRCDFCDAKIIMSKLSHTSFDGANLKNVNFQHSHLIETDFCGANLTSTRLEYAIMHNCKHDETTSFFALQCPETGSFIGYKQAEGYIVKLQIPAKAKRSSATSRKCRCSEAKVLGIYRQNGKKAPINIIHSSYDYYFNYKVGETVRVKDFDENRWNECSTGIHFFLTFEEAKNYQM